MHTHSLSSLYPSFLQKHVIPHCGLRPKCDQREPQWFLQHNRQEIDDVSQVTKRDRGFVHTLGLWSREHVHTTDIGDWAFNKCGKVLKIIIIGNYV